MACNVFVLPIVLYSSKTADLDKCSMVLYNMKTLYPLILPAQSTIKVETSTVALISGSLLNHQFKICLALFVNAMILVNLQFNCIYKK